MSVIGGLIATTWNLAAAIVWVLALVRVARTPAGQFLHGWWTKAGRLWWAAGLWFIIGGIFLPVGAGLVLVGLQRAGRQTQPVQAAKARGPRLPE